MALEYFFDAKTCIIRIVGQGKVSLDDRIYFIRRLLDDPDLPDTAAILVEVNNVVNAPTAEEIPVIGMLIDRLHSKFLGRIAITNVIAGHVTFSHLVALSTSDPRREVRVFRSESEARNWLTSEP